VSAPRHAEVTPSLDWKHIIGVYLAHSKALPLSVRRFYSLDAFLRVYVGENLQENKMTSRRELNGLFEMILGDWVQMAHDSGYITRLRAGPDQP
jgi:hypothetical protein